MGLELVGMVLLIIILRVPIKWLTGVDIFRP